MADIDSQLRQWSATASNNKPTGATPIGANLDDNLRQICATVRQYLASPGSTMSSAATVDLSTADGRSIPISGSSTVTGLGTEVAGIEYILTTLGTQTWKHSSALSLPGAADITTGSGDYMLAQSKGSGNWVIPWFTKASLSPYQPFSDATALVKSSVSASNTLRLSASALTSARVVTIPDYDSRMMTQTHGSDLASTATLNCDAATGDLVDITGTTTVTGITLSDGKWTTARFTGALTLVNSTALVLPGVANITTAAGDFAVFRGYTGGIVRCCSYIKADGTPVVNANGTTITLSTAQNTTSGTSIDFTGIPSWVKRVNIIFNAVSTNGTSEVLIQIGSGSVDTTGYLAAAMRVSAATTSTSGFCISGGAHTAATTLSGTITLSLVGSNIWASSGNVVGIANATAVCSAGGKTLSGALDRVRLTTSGGTDTFDAGSVNISYE